jgi:hypothetical protein
VYKWVDKDGKVCYGDRPKHPAEQVDIRTGATVPEEASGPGGQAQAAKSAECEKKKALLQSYRKAATIKETDSLGRTREYSEEERLQLLASTERQANEACNLAAAP